MRSEIHNIRPAECYDKDAPPRLRHHRDITLSSVARFYELSGGKRTAYSYKEIGHADQR